MRLHISLDDSVVEDLDRRIGPRRRSAFIVAALLRALADARRWDEIESSLGTIEDAGHPWDLDPAAWVRDSRQVGGQRDGQRDGQRVG